MRVLVLGGSGMLGHKLWQSFQDKFEVYATLRSRQAAYVYDELFESSRIEQNVTAENFDSVIRAIANTQPDVVVNCIGIVKQDAAAQDPLVSIPVNALLPHRLFQICRMRGSRLIHLSTDCVFSGQKGKYREDDFADARDLYGRSKLLGEVSQEGCLTLRTSMIGRELQGANGLVEWFLKQSGSSVSGYKRAIFSGFTTIALAEIIGRIITEQPHLSGVWHVASQAISKYDLLVLIKETYKLDIEIKPDETVVCDRSLDGSRFSHATGFTPPGWAEMIHKMHQDTTSYSRLRSRTC